LGTNCGEGLLGLRVRAIGLEDYGRGWGSGKGKGKVRLVAN